MNENTKSCFSSRYYQIQIEETQNDRVNID